MRRRLRSCRSGMLLAAAAACVSLTGCTQPGDVGAAVPAKLREPAKEFAQLDQADQQQLSTLFQAVSSDPKLKEAMTRYLSWLDSLSPADRERVLAAAPAERLAVVEAIIAEQRSTLAALARDLHLSERGPGGSGSPGGPGGPDRGPGGSGGPGGPGGPPFAGPSGRNDRELPEYLRDPNFLRKFWDRLSESMTLEEQAAFDLARQNRDMELIRLMSSLVSARRPIPDFPGSRGMVEMRDEALDQIFHFTYGFRRASGKEKYQELSDPQKEEFRRLAGLFVFADLPTAADRQKIIPSLDESGRSLLERLRMLDPTRGTLAFSLAYWSTLPQKRPDVLKKERVLEQLFGERLILAEVPDAPPPSRGFGRIDDRGFGRPGEGRPGESRPGEGNGSNGGMRPERRGPPPGAPPAPPTGNSIPAGPEPEGGKRPQPAPPAPAAAPAANGPSPDGGPKASKPAAPVTSKKS